MRFHGHSETFQKKKRTISKRPRRSLASGGLAVSGGITLVPPHPNRLRSRRGKTFECQAQRDLLLAEGEPAFFLEIATLSGGGLRDMLDTEEEAHFESWLRAQSETATFFLGLHDELKLTLGSFEQALKRLNKALAGQLGRARIVITTRRISVDQRLNSKASANSGDGGGWSNRRSLC